MLYATAAYAFPPLLASLNTVLLGRRAQSRSPEPLLTAYNLGLSPPGQLASLECTFLSKIFAANGQPNSG